MSRKTCFPRLSQPNISLQQNQIASMWIKQFEICIIQELSSVSLAVVSFEIPPFLKVQVSTLLPRLFYCNFTHSSVHKGGAAQRCCTVAYTGWSGVELLHSGVHSGERCSVAIANFSLHHFLYAHPLSTLYPKDPPSQVKSELLGLKYTNTIYHIYHNNQYNMTFRHASV